MFNSEFNSEFSSAILVLCCSWCTSSCRYSENWLKPIEKGETLVISLLEHILASQLVDRKQDSDGTQYRGGRCTSDGFQPGCVEAEALLAPVGVSSLVAARPLRLQLLGW